MRTVIISDTHLTHHPNSQLYDYISKIISRADQVIINGDFWDGYLTTWDAFVSSEWRGLLVQLSSKETIYVYGNHDKEEFFDERFHHFFKKGVNAYTFVSGKNSITVQHGHLLAPAKDHYWLFHNPVITRPLYRCVVGVFYYLPWVEFLFNTFHQDAVDQNQLQMFIEYAQHKRAPHTWFVFGHAHLSYCSEADGVIACGLHPDARYSYVVVENGTIRQEFVD